MNEAQSTPANLQILSKMKQVPSNYFWCPQHLGGRGLRDSLVRQGAPWQVSKWPALREGWSQPGVVVQCLGTCWVMVVLQVPPATAPLTWLAKQTSEIILWLPLYHFESCWKQVCVLVTSWIHALVANAQGWPQGPPHTVWPISTLPLFWLHFHVCTSLNISGVDYLSVVLLHGRDSSLLHLWAQLHVRGWWNDI